MFPNISGRLQRIRAWIGKQDEKVDLHQNVLADLALLSRRKFLGGLIATVPALVVGKELGELLAPERTIFITTTAAIVTEGNRLLTMGDIIESARLFIPQLWAAEVARKFKDSLILSSYTETQVRRRQAS